MSETSAKLANAVQVNEARLKELSSELRCLVCQNQSIADSTAGLALDLKQQIVQQMQQGRNNDQIKQYMVERYGEFVLYKPAYSVGNIALWAGPFVLLLLAIVVARKWWKKSSGIVVRASAPSSTNASMQIEDSYQAWKKTQTEP